ncbi:AraC family transcriptional regulator [Pseudooctadecabacter jejudonensis]|uniref:HTH-type transcriptional activator Btr n=1 Tax=Pseudooctadecabacter jejudonensis TaxID=1391910 RepID=A0A1Y5RGY8_9RHOB|nr:AraC family transcriptional regulator [Pseudooctadecabacter jejudonensis]SLN16935.1 HTH-type transcriptional activator Btr [Pseudooctadecabacter jejudonensis]
MFADPQDRLSLTAIAQNAAHGKWRTEAMRSHQTPRLIFVAKGQGRITVAGLTRGFGANNLIFLPPKTMYGFECGPTVYGQMLTIPQAMASEWPLEPVHLRLRDVVAQKDLAVHLDALERELKSTQPGSDRAAHYQLGLLAIYFERQLDAHEDDGPDTRHETASARLVAAYTDLIEHHFRESRGVSDYAAMLGVTPTHLTRCCKQTSGKSALDLLKDRVLFEARLMLRDSSLPVRQVADDLGFGSAAYFTRAFQAKTGQTPTSFRKKGPLSVA